MFGEFRVVCGDTNLGNHEVCRDTNLGNHKVYGKINLEEAFIELPHSS